jgi:hypothetical protein
MVFLRNPYELYSGKKMKKTIIQGLILVLSFLLLWFLLSQVNWTTILKLDKANKYMEDKLPIILSLADNT